MTWQPEPARGSRGRDVAASTWRLSVAAILGVFAVPGPYAGLFAAWG